MTLIAQFNKLTFGIEIETTGRGRQEVAHAIRSVVGGTVQHTGGVYDAHRVIAADGRVWSAVRDASVTGANYGQMAEVVSPILRYEDMDTLQQVVRAIRKIGARVDDSCGIHIHLGVDAFTVKAVTNLLKMVYKQENILYRALACESRERWAGKIGTKTYACAELMNLVNRGQIKDMDDLRTAWYGHNNLNPSHYDQSRYHGLNLHNIFFRGTVEFRWFAATLHAGKIKAYVQLVMAMGCKAINARSTSGKARREINAQSAKYDWRVFLLGLGMIGDEFATARKHLLANLDGDSGFKHGRAQRPAPAERTPAEAEADSMAIADHIASMSMN